MTYLPMNKIIQLSLLAIIIRSVFSEDGKLYRQLFLDGTIYESGKCYSSKQLMFQKKFM